MARPSRGSTLSADGWLTAPQATAHTSVGQELLPHRAVACGEFEKLQIVWITILVVTTRTLPKDSNLDTRLDYFRSFSTVSSFMPEDSLVCIRCFSQHSCLSLLTPPSTTPQATKLCLQDHPVRKHQLAQTPATERLHYTKQCPLTWSS